MTTLVSTDLLSLVLRIVVGLALVMHGLPKAKAGWGKQSGEWIGTMGVPPVAARLVTVLELFGGIFLVIGLLVPVVAALFVVQFAAIIVMKAMKMDAGPIGGGNKANYEIDLAYLLLSLAIVMLGAGAYSIDAAIGVL